jgi:PelA/Pel-15E family pectate lyase
LPLLAQDNKADNILLFQRSAGGWSKEYKGKQPVDYQKEYDASEKAAILDDSTKNDATIDNGATTKEIRYLVKAYKTTKTERYLQAAERGIRYLLTSQYKNGGFPQFYPNLTGYHSQVTYNDNAMINVLNLLQDIALGENEMDGLNKQLISQTATAVKNGVACILNTQLKVNGKLTAWCAQYDAKTLQPAKARAYELPSLSGMESVAIVSFLMRQRNPSNEIKIAINSAVEWLDKVKIEGYTYTEIPAPSLPKGRDRVIVPSEGSEIWARFYEIETSEPFFCGRDGVKKKTVAEIDYERRNGYAWYGGWPKKLLTETYPEWKKNNG